MDCGGCQKTLWVETDDTFRYLQIYIHVDVSGCIHYNQRSEYENKNVLKPVTDNHL